MIKLKSEPQRPPRRRRRRRLLLLVMLVAVAALLAERWRGEWTLRKWKNEMAAKGEVFDAKALWPAAGTGSVEFSNQLAQAAANSRGRLGLYASQMSAIVVQEPGKARRGSQEPQPLLSRKDGSTNTWLDLDALLQQSQTSLNALRELTKNPPPTMGCDVVKCLGDDSFPNFIAVRLGAQVLCAAAINDLHKGDLTAAAQDLGALLSFAKLYENDPGLVNYMIRIAIIGLSVDVCWDALQAKGWTEPQLAALQKQCVDTSRLLSQMPRTLENERCERIYMLDWFRSHSYETWVARNRQLYEPFGCQPPAADTAAPVRRWRQWVFHPVWSFAWADQEELEYLEHEQPEIMAVREAVEHHSWLRLKEQIAANRRDYHAPAATWRFYVRLPLVDDFGDTVGGAKAPVAAYPYPDFSKAYLTAMKNLTLHEMVITAIAIKRFELSHGKPPSNLADLTPSLLPAPPRDLMDGQPLRYRLNPNRSYTLYSVGEDGRDDDGIAVSESAAQSSDTASPWNGRDWLWPHLVAANKRPPG